MSNLLIFLPVLGRKEEGTNFIAVNKRKFEIDPTRLWGQKAGERNIIEAQES